MKITEITINLIPSIGETASPRQLQRNLDKKWTGESPSEMPITSDGGLYPGEIRLINEIQNIIGTFNSVDKRNA